MFSLFACTVPYRKISAQDFCQCVRRILESMKVAEVILSVVVFSVVSWVVKTMCELASSKT